MTIISTACSVLSECTTFFLKFDSMLDSMLERVYYNLKSRLFCKLFKQGEGAGFSFLASFPPSLLYYCPPHLSLSLYL